MRRGGNIPRRFHGPRGTEIPRFAGGGMFMSGTQAFRPMAEAARSQPLTIQERILLHLEPHTKEREAYTVPKDVTQAGIAASLAIRVAHASREVRKLVESNLAEERDAAVSGAKRHQKAYFLTPSGVVAAQKMRKEFGPSASLAEGTPAPGAPRGAPVAVVRDLAPLRYFFGRQEELEAAR